jgi:hypothetical protein
MTHGMYGSPTYRSWAAMLSRCTNPNRDTYSYFGGRGIRVCASWSEFKNFFADLGRRPEGHSLRRHDTSGHYEPSNCQWVPDTKSRRLRRRAA